jgi:multidrug efflux pump subunit AcrA (membrane-fusion protein)
MQEEPTPTPIPTPIVAAKPIYKVARGEVVKSLLLSGRVSPVKESELFFKVSGRVRNVMVKKGDAVKTGQVLADLEIDDLERDLIGAKLELERAQGRLKAAEDDLAANVKRAQANLVIAQENLAITQTQDPAPRKTQAETALKRAEIALQKAQADYNAIAWRGDVGATPQAAALQRATLDYADAQAAYELALQAIATHSHQVTIAQRQVELAQITLDGLGAGVDPLLVNDVKRAELNVTKLEAAIASAQIIAPFDGLVSSISLTEGRPVDAYRAMVTVSDPATQEVRCDPTGVALNELAENMTATVFLVSRPGVEIPAKVIRVPVTNWQAKETEVERTIGVKLEESATKFEVGDLVRVQIVLERKADVLWLPPAAIRTFEGRRFVVVQENAGQRRVDLKVGIEGEDRVEIEAGLTEGQTVIGQ